MTLLQLLLLYHTNYEGNGTKQQDLDQRQANNKGTKACLTPNLHNRKETRKLSAGKCDRCRFTETKLFGVRIV